VDNCKSISNGNEWLAKLMREPDTDLRTTALRIIETRRIFAETEFNWKAVTYILSTHTSSLYFTFQS
jgi:hypothetical protein